MCTVHSSLHPQTKEVKTEEKQFMHQKFSYICFINPRTLVDLSFPRNLRIYEVGHYNGHNDIMTTLNTLLLDVTMYPTIAYWQLDLSVSNDIFDGISNLMTT